METLIAVVHILTALVMIALILVQDTKSGSVGGAFGGGGSNSILGATGATTLAQKMTRIAAIVFALTSISLTVFSSRNHKSVIDDVVTNSAPAATGVAPAPSTNPEAAPAADHPVDGAASAAPAVPAPTAVPAAPTH
jgi:preprotein translocase subunit SecG